MPQTAIDHAFKFDLPLQYLFQAADPSSSNPKLLILMHGFGSNEADMFGLAPLIPKNFHVLSLRAPIGLGGPAFAWFAIEFTATGRTVDEAQEVSSRSLLAGVIESAAKQLRVAAENVVVGGFSQGAIMSVSMLLTRPELFSGAMALHGRLMTQIASLVQAPDKFANKRLWVSGGTDDTMVSLADSITISNRAKELGIATSFAEFPGAHELRPAELAAAIDWLSH